MPITEPAQHAATLSQGDILEGIRLFVTKESPDGGEAVLSKASMALVLSRPCVAAHKGSVTVAAIEKYAGNVPADVKTFDEVLGFLQDTRDAPDSPDVFYIGQISNREGRFCARLDSIHCVQIPKDGALRQAFLAKHRVARLHPDFARDLHLRHFRAFSSLGFDDISWFSTEDLIWLVAAGRAELAGAESELREKQAAKERKGFEQKPFPEKEITQAEGNVAGLKEKLAPFEAELIARPKPPMGSGSSASD